MLAVGAAALGVGPSLAHVVDSVSGVDRKPTPILLLPVDGRVATALRPGGVEESWTSTTSGGTRRGGSGRRSATSGGVDDASYRYRRQRNNEAARRSREKRRQQDGVIRRQLEALVAENRELRSQLALFRRLLDDVAACRKDGALRPGSSLSSVASSVALSTGSDQSRHGDQSRHDDVADESSVDDGAESATEDGGRDARGSSTWRQHAAPVESTDDAVDWQHHQLMTPLNLCRRVASS